MSARASLKSIIFWPVLTIPLTVCTIFLMVPCLPLLFCKPKWFRWCVDNICAFYQVYPVAIIELVCGVKYIINGELPSPETSNNLIIMNHRTRLDWLFYWAVLVRSSFKSLAQNKILLQMPLKFFPVIGSPCQFAGYIFLDKSDFEKGKAHINAMLDLHKRYRDSYTVLFFPEGLDLCEVGVTKSNDYARKNNLPQYRYTLHPRTNGFVHIVTTMMKEHGLDSVYDMTVAYRPETRIPSTELAVALGSIPAEVHLHTKRYRAIDLPTDEQGLKEFCKQRWEKKEQMLAEFYTSDKPLNQDEAISPNSYTLYKPMLIVTSFIWLLLSSLAFYSIFYLSYFWYMLAYIIFTNLILLYFNRLHNGLDVYQTKY